MPQACAECDKSESPVGPERDCRNLGNPRQSARALSGSQNPAACYARLGGVRVALTNPESSFAIRPATAAISRCNRAYSVLVNLHRVPPSVTQSRLAAAGDTFP